MSAEWGGHKVEEAEAAMPGGAEEIEYIRVRPAGKEGQSGGSGWEAAHSKYALAGSTVCGQAPAKAPGPAGASSQHHPTADACAQRLWGT